MRHSRLGIFSIKEIIALVLLTRDVIFYFEDWRINKKTSLESCHSVTGTNMVTDIMGNEAKYLFFTSSHLFSINQCNLMLISY
jgi:hypothetical protein